MGAKIVGIIDRNGGLIDTEGFSFEEIRLLFLSKNGNTLVSDQMMPFDKINREIWDCKADIFAPCAASRLITKEQIQR